jgi:hypothetical protein
LQLLALRGVFAWRNNSGAFVIREAGRRRFVRAGLVGGSDILGVLPGGRFLAVPGNRPTAAQRAFLDQVTAAGGLALVGYDVAELSRFLDGSKKCLG